MSSHIAITGGTGFIGSAIVRELISQGNTVTVLLRPQSNTSRLHNVDGCRFVTASSLAELPSVKELKQHPPDVFIHCGWRGVAGRDRNEIYQVTENIPMTIDAVTAAADLGCRQWIGLGSQAEYGNPNRCIDEDYPRRPTHTYGQAKLSAGIAALALCEARNLAGAWLRVFSTFGPRDSPQWLIPYVTQELLHGRSPKLTRCEQLWDYLYVQDAAKAVTAVAEQNTGGVFNLGSGTARPLKDFIQAISDEVDSDVTPDFGAVPYREDQVMHLEANIARLTAATGWTPNTTLADGISATVAFERQRD